MKHMQQLVEAMDLNVGESNSNGALHYLVSSAYLLWRQLLTVGRAWGGDKQIVNIPLCALLKPLFCSLVSCVGGRRRLLPDNVANPVLRRFYELAALKAVNPNATVRTSMQAQHQQPCMALQLADCATDLAEATLQASMDDMPAAQPLRAELLTLFAPPQPPEDHSVAEGPAVAAAPGDAAEERDVETEAVAQRIGLANPGADLEHVVQQVSTRPGALVLSRA